MIVDTDATTEFKDEDDNPITDVDELDAFFDAAVSGKLVKVKDDEPGDGVADEIELEN